MENDQSTASVSTPSKLRPPKARKELSAIFAETEANPIAADVSGIKPKVNDENIVASNTLGKRAAGSPPKERPRLTLPEAMPPGRTKASITATKPAPTIKQRPAPRTSALGRPKIPAYNPAESIYHSSGQMPKWDRKSRLESTEREIQEIKKQLEQTSVSSNTYQKDLQDAKTSIRLLEEEKGHLLSKVASKDREIDDLNEDLRRLRRKFEDEIDAIKGEKSQVSSKLEEQIVELNRKKEDLERDKFELKSQLTLIQGENTKLQSIVAEYSSTILHLESQIGALKGRLEASTNDGEVKTKTISSLEASLSEKSHELSVASQKLREGERLRRKLHNMVQELKGNIRVFCRVRPLLASDAAAQAGMSHIEISRNENEQEEIKLIQSSENATGSQVSKSFPFVFDKVFTPSNTQEDVFEEISQLVQSALDGYRVCIFAYGQTGSGKTFTMEGNPSDPQLVGMIPRAVHQIFESTAALAEKGWSFEFEVSYLEIYNESIKDLLSGASKDTKHEIKHVASKTHVTDLTLQKVLGSEEIFTLLRRAAQNRAVAETQCNERSSRSHSVFTMNINGSNSVTGEKIEGILHLVDLAGSERLSQSGSTGDRLKETQAINKSLSSLGDVIHSISNKESHIPYRNSKLTYLLQNSLGGNCKTLMFVNISPSVENIGESLCSLRFATKVNSCQIGTATRKIINK